MTTSHYVQDPNASRVYPGMTFQNSYGTCTVIGPRAVGTLWDVELHDGRIHPMRPSTIIAAVAVMTDRTRNRIALLTCSLEQAKDLLTRHIGTICEDDYRDMVARYEARLAAERRRSA